VAIGKGGGGPEIGPRELQQPRRVKRRALPDPVQAPAFPGDPARPRGRVHDGRQANGPRLYGGHHRLTWAA